MNILKSVPILLSSAGLIFGVSYGAESLMGNSALAAGSTAEPLRIAQGGQSITPAAQSGPARMTLTTSSLKQGKNTFMLKVVDSSGKPLANKAVQAQMVMSAKEMDAMGMKGMGAASAKTQVTPATTPGLFAIETTIPFGGHWQLKVNLKAVQPPATAVFNLAVK